MGAPYSAEKLKIEIAGGSAALVAMRAPWRGELTRVVATQVQGVLQGFSLAVYNSGDILQPGESSSEGGDLDQFTPDAELHRVTPDLTANTGVATISHFTSYPYINRDGTNANPERLLYFLLTAGGTGNKEFQLALTAVGTDM